MKPDEVINRGFTGRLILLILGVFIVFTVFSATYIYLDMYRPLNTHYSAIVSIISGISDTLTAKTLRINAISFLLIFSGIMVLGVLYTHRIVGPLQRVKMFAKMVTAGKMNAKMTFRKKDAIQPFKDSFNTMTKKHTERLARIDSEVRELKASITTLKLSVAEGSDTGTEMKKILRSEEEIRKLLSDINL